VGTQSNRDAIGALVRLESGGNHAIADGKSGSSYLSQSELPLTFGLGGAIRRRGLRFNGERANRGISQREVRKIVPMR